MSIMLVQPIKRKTTDDKNVGPQQTSLSLLLKQVLYVSKVLQLSHLWQLMGDLIRI